MSKKGNIDINFYLARSLFNLLIATIKDVCVCVLYIYIYILTGLVDVKNVDFQLHSKQNHLGANKPVFVHFYPRWIKNLRNLLLKVSCTHGNFDEARDGGRGSADGTQQSH